MAESMDPDVQDELLAMTGAPKVPLFGGIRTLSKSLTFFHVNMFIYRNSEY